MSPKVSVIGIAYNHEPYIQEALKSLMSQDYPNLQVILMDDGSKDGSTSLLKQFAVEKEEIELILHPENQGYTKTFNEGLARATGDFIIDFALDDVMLPGFIFKSVEALTNAGIDHGVSFCNADYIDANSVVTANHFEQLKAKGMITEMPSGDIFEMALRRYFICTPTIVVRASGV